MNVPHSSQIATVAPPRWRQVLAAGVTDARELTDMLGLARGLAADAEAAAHAFPCRVPRTFVERMQAGNPDDPLLRQVLPLHAEMDKAEGFVADPLQECDALRAPRLLHKYPGRALLLLTSACAMHCRYCFRRHRSHLDVRPDPAAWQPAIDLLASDPSLHEIILSGGDPLTLDDPELADLISRLAAVPHLRRLRIHTRLPVAIPERVTGPLIDCLTASPLSTIVVVQVNHAQELSGPCPDALRKLVRGGIPILNQSVLLRGVNDSLETLTHLCEKLADFGILPYYLHQLDPVAGAVHFRVPVSKGKRLVSELRNRLPGYAVPRYVEEIPGTLSKTILA